MTILKWFLGLVLPLMVSYNCVKVTPRPPKEIDPDELEAINQACGESKYDFWRTSNYILPYPVGSSYSIGLSHCGGSFHSIGTPDQFAIDFQMSIGSTISASRPGVVVFVEESGFDGEFPNNKIVIEHADGTFAQYMHLTYNGSLVREGENIVIGRRIGLSGSTGYAGYPHLHFVATQRGSWNYPYTSFPTTFRNTVANELSLKSGQTYTALPYDN